MAPSVSFGHNRPIAFRESRYRSRPLMAMRMQLAEVLTGGLEKTLLWDLTRQLGVEQVVSGGSTRPLRSASLELRPSPRSSKSGSARKGSSLPSSSQRHRRFRSSPELRYRRSRRAHCALLPVDREHGEAEISRSCATTGWPELAGPVVISIYRSVAARWSLVTITQRLKRSAQPSSAR